MECDPGEGESPGAPMLIEAAEPALHPDPLPARAGEGAELSPLQQHAELEIAEGGVIPPDPLMQLGR